MKKNDLIFGNSDVYYENMLSFSVTTYENGYVDHLVHWNWNEHVYIFNLSSLKYTN